MNLRAVIIIFMLEEISAGGLVGQRAEFMITLGSQYYDTVDASIDCE